MGGWADEPADGLADVLDLILWDMSNPPGQKEGRLWLDELRARPDAASPEMQKAIAVMEHYLEPSEDRADTVD